MSGRAIDLELEPSGHRAEDLRVQTYSYEGTPDDYLDLGGNVYLGIYSGSARITVRFTPDEARVLARQLLQSAGVADRHRAAEPALAP